jgi:serine phosphatase RsbU (regulator of sigma subunit)
MLLISINGVAQKYADKEYYLVDSIVLDELTEGDRELLKTSLKMYHSAKDDTSKVNAISVIIEEISDDKLWPKYNFWMYDFVKLKLTHLPNKKTTSQFPILIFFKKALAEALNTIGYVYQHNQGDIRLALDYYQKSLIIFKEINEREGIAMCYNNIGYLHDEQGDIALALAYFHKSLKIQEELNEKEGMAISYTNIGSIYYNQKDIALALTYFHKSLKIDEETRDKHGMALSYNNIGAIHDEQGEIPLALEYYHKSLEIQEEINDKHGMALSYNNIGYIHDIQGDLLLALDYYQKSLKIREEIEDKKGMVYSYNNIASIYMKQGIIGGTEKALVFALKSLQISQEIGYPENTRNASELLSEIYEKQGKGMKALEMYKLYVQMKDSINNEETQKVSAKQQAKYEYEKQKVIDDAENDKLISIEKEAKEKQQVITYATGTGLGLVGIFLFFVFNRLQVTRKQKKVIEEQKQEVEQQKEVVEVAHHQLEEKNQEIMDSITYAKRIQSAILPPAKVVKEYLQESFILYKPKDIVAGDFYWLEHADNKVLFAAADCTGHGVPGAMVSVVCNNALNRSVREHGLTDPGKILNKTREIVVSEFEKSDEEVKDGMDIAICSLEGNKLQYAGANNPLWIIRKGEIIETKANKQPIGQFDNPEPYTTHTFELEKGDSTYIFSDGYVDQFGGEKGKKFKAKAFRELLLSIQDKTMEEQKKIIDEAFETWKGALEQIDDVCVIGVRV